MQTIQVSSEQELNQYKNTPSTCGTPPDFYGLAEYKYVVVKNGIEHEMYKKAKFCPTCFDMRNNIKTCLKCEKEFVPSCNIRHLCGVCYSNNKYNANAEGW